VDETAAVDEFWMRISNPLLRFRYFDDKTVLEKSPRHYVAFRLVARRRS